MAGALHCVLGQETLLTLVVSLSGVVINGYPQIKDGGER